MWYLITSSSPDFGRHHSLRHQQHLTSSPPQQHHPVLSRNRTFNDSGAMADSLSCQRCHQPLLRDPSVANITPSQYALIAGTLPDPSAPSSLPPKAKLDALPPASHASAAAWASANPITESYVLLPDRTGSPVAAVKRDAQGTRSRSGSAAGPSKDAKSKPAKEKKEKERKGKEDDPRASPAPSSDSQQSQHQHSRPSSPQGNRPRLAANLDLLLSSRSNIDHPLCVECTGLFQAELQREIEELTRERDAYIAFERGLRKRTASGATAGGEDREDEALVGTSDEWDALVARRAELEEEEKTLRASLKAREAELDRAKEEEAQVKADEEAVERDEAQ